jgi:hypothetical protein
MTHRSTAPKNMVIYSALIGIQTRYLARMVQILRILGTVAV